MNNAAIDNGVTGIVKIDVPASWADAADEAAPVKDVPEFVTKILEPVNAQEGDSLPVSTFIGLEDGAFPQGTAAYEKRGVAINVPEWDAEKMYPVQPVFLRLPARSYSSGSLDG